MGWLNFHARLVREVKKADEKEVRTELCTYHGTEGCMACARVPQQSLPLHSQRALPPQLDIFSCHKSLELLCHLTLR